MGGESSWTIRNKAGIGSRVWYGGCPSRSSITTQPTLLSLVNIEILQEKNQIIPYVRGCRCSRLFNDLRCHYRSDQNSHTVQNILLPTPIGTADNCTVCHTSCPRSHTKVCQFNSAILVRKDICTLYVTVDDTLIMQIDKTFKHLGDINRDEILRKLAKALGDVM